MKDDRNLEAELKLWTKNFWLVDMLNHSDAAI